MEFWVGLTAVELLLMCTMCFFENNCKIFIYAELSIIWVVASFRYLIGADYSQYMSWYMGELENNMLLLENLESSFIILVKVLNDLGGSFQTIFIVYETISLSFFYKGLVFFVKEDKEKMLALVLYSFLYNGFWYSMNNIRGAAAIAILFWGSQFIFKRDFRKFFLSVALASCVHYSAMFFVLVYSVSFVKFKIKFKLEVFIILLSMCIGYFKLSLDILMFFMKNLSNYGDKYADLLVALNGEWRLSFDIFIVVCTVLLGTVIADRFDEKRNGIFLLSLTYCVLYISMNFQFYSVTITDIFGRISKYFFFFYLVFLTKLINEISNKIKPSFMILIMACVLYGLLFNYNVYKVGTDPIAKSMGAYLSQGNINYEFNFSLFK